MAVELTGTALHLKPTYYGTCPDCMSAGSEDITVPTDCDLILVNISGGGQFTSDPVCDLNSTDDFTQELNLYRGSPDFISEVVEYLVSPDTGSQTLNWTAANMYSGLQIVVTFWKGVDTTDPIGDTIGPTHNVQNVSVSSCGTDDALVGMYTSFNKNLNIAPAAQNQTIIKEDVYGGARYNYIGVAYEIDDTIFYATGTVDNTCLLCAVVIQSAVSAPTAVEKIGTAATYYRPTYGSDDDQGNRSITVPTDCDCIVATFVCNWNDDGSKWYEWAAPFFKLGTTPFQKAVANFEPQGSYNQFIAIEVLAAPATGSQTLYWDTTELATVTPTEGVVIIWDYYKNVDPDDPLVDWDTGVESGIDITGMSFTTGDMMVGVGMRNHSSTSITVTDSSQTLVWAVQADGASRDNWGAMAYKASVGAFYATDSDGEGATAAIVLRFFVEDAFSYGGSDGGELGFSEVAGAEAEVGTGAGIGFTEEADGETDIGGGIYAGIGFNVLAGGAAGEGAAAQLGFTEVAGAFNLSGTLRAYGAILVFSYEATLSGDADGESDLPLPGLKSIQLRLRQGDPSYLGLVLVYSNELLGEIQARANGDISVEMIGKANGDEVLRESLIVADFDSVRFDRGSESQSITLVGYRTESWSGSAVPIELPAVMAESMSTAGLMRYRCGRPDFYLKPGHTAAHGATEITVDQIYYNIQAAVQYMDVSE